MATPSLPSPPSAQDDWLYPLGMDWKANSAIRYSTAPDGYILRERHPSSSGCPRSSGNMKRKSASISRKVASTFITVARGGLKPSGQKGSRGRLIGRTKGGLGPKLHVLADAKCRPIRMFLSAGQTSDFTEARAFLSLTAEAAVEALDEAVLHEFQPHRRARFLRRH